MYFLIDYENVQKDGFVGIHLLKSTDSLTIFYSEHCKTVEKRFLSKIAESGCQFDVKKLSKKGKNALDFYIATKVGYIFGSGYQGEIAIVSKDSGFSAVSDYWEKEKEKRIVLLASSIETCILNSESNDERIDIIKAGKKTVNLNDLMNEEPSSKELSESNESNEFNESNVSSSPKTTKKKEAKSTPTIRSLMKGSEFEKSIQYVEALLIKPKDKQNARIKLDKAFGTKNGLRVYNLIKPALKI